jgi:GNAT superfamily N-acetyltransferase
LTASKIVRAATLDDVLAIALVHVDAWRETYPGMFPQPVLDALTYEERELQWRRALASGTGGLFVAQVDREVVGFAACGRNRDPDYESTHPGELQAMYLLESYHGLGLGRSLFTAVRVWLESRALTPFMLWVVVENPACAFYERLGGTCIVTRPAEARGAQIIESAYAWQ